MLSTARSLQSLSSNPTRGTDAYLISLDVPVMPVMQCRRGTMICQFPTKGVLPSIYEHAETGETGGNGMPYKTKQ
jgi:hypothetical protein